MPPDVSPSRAWKLRLLGANRSHCSLYDLMSYLTNAAWL